MLLVSSSHILFNWLILIKYISTLYLTSPKSKEEELFAKSCIFYRISNITTVYLHLVEIPSWDHKANKNKGNFPSFILMVFIQEEDTKPTMKFAK